MTQRSSYTPLRLLALSAIVSIGLVGSCTPPNQPEPPRSGIEPAGSSSDGTWRYDFYVNHDAPCSESGEQTFLVATREGSDPDATTPLWTFLHGGGAGYYTPDGDPMPSAANKQQEDASRLHSKLVGGLVGRAKESPSVFRFLAVSMCSHDTYAGYNTPDPGNDTRYEGQKGVPTTGLSATVAAIDWVKANYPTSDVVLHGGSAGAVGTFHVGYWMQVHGQAPAAIIADSAVINAHWQDAQNVIGDRLPDGSPNRCYRTPEAMAGIPARWDPLFRTDDDQAHRRLELDQLTVPVMHVWSTNDSNQCGSRLMDCPLPNGSTVTLGSTQCNNRPIHDAIEALPPSRHSVDLEVCVDRPGATHPEDCDWHVPTQTDDTPNTKVPAGHPERDYNGLILDWAEARLTSGAA
jgi:hypothetical protein